MALIEVTLGNAYADQLNPPTTIRSLYHTGVTEFHPDDIFEALQRIGHPTDPVADHLIADIERIRVRFHAEAGYHPTWNLTLRHLRSKMERRHAPSMSVGDTITLYTSLDENQERTPLVTYTCESMGWSAAAPTTQ